MKNPDIEKPLSPTERVELERLRKRFNESCDYTQEEMARINRHNQFVLAHASMRSMGIR